MARAGAIQKLCFSDLFFDDPPNTADGTAEFITGSELSGTSTALEMKIVNQLKIATQPAIAKVVVDWGQLGPLPPPSYEQLTSGNADVAVVVDATTAAVPVAGAPKSPRSGSLTLCCFFARDRRVIVLSSAPVDVGGDATLTTFVVECADTVPGEELALIGSLPALGSETFAIDRSVVA